MCSSYIARASALHRLSYCTSEDIWPWLRGPLLNAFSGDTFFVKQGAANLLCARDPQPANRSYPDFGFIGDADKIIAPVYMRQLRVPKGTCPVRLSNPKVQFPAPSAVLQAAV
jgi:hypothetical protein